MIIARYLLKEIGQTFFAVCLVLMLISLSGQLVSVFSEVAAGNLSVNTVMLVLGLKSLKILMIILPLSLFLSVLMTLSRLYQNNEMTVIMACGISQFYILRIVLSLAFLFAIIVSIFTFQIIPWANSTQQQIELAAENVSELEGMTAGRFREISSGIGVMYVESMNDDHSQMQNIFIQQKLKDEAEVVIRADSGHQETDETTGDRFMVLEKGTRFERTPGELDYSLIEYERHGVRIHEKSPAKIPLKHSAAPTLQLLKIEALIAKAELHSRMAPVLLCILLAAIAVPLSLTSPRQDRYLRLGLGLLVYIVFTNLINIGKSWIILGKVSPSLGLWWVHALMLSFVIILFLQQTGFRYLFAREKRT